MTPSELDAIEARAKAAEAGTAWGVGNAHLRPIVSDVPALVAEVRRLRDALDLAVKLLDPADPKLEPIPDLKMDWDAPGISSRIFGDTDD